MLSDLWRGWSMCSAIFECAFASLILREGLGGPLDSSLLSYSAWFWYLTGAAFTQHPEESTPVFLYHTQSFFFKALSEMPTVSDFSC